MSSFVFTVLEGGRCFVRFVVALIIYPTKIK